MKTPASNDAPAAGLSLNRDACKEYLPQLFGTGGILRKAFGRLGMANDHLKMLQEHMQNGEATGAVVLFENPLLIAAYNTETDGVVMLFFEQQFRTSYRLKKGDRMLVVNRYGQADAYQADLIVGKNARENFQEVYPVIADFFATDQDRVQALKEGVDNTLWNKIHRMGNDYLKRKKKVYRIGLPIQSFEVR